MKSQYDVVIVGAGIAGAICGAYLAKGGLRVAVFEKASGIGGRMRLDETSPGFTGFEHWVAFGQGWGGGAWYRAARELDADVRFYEVPEPCLYYRGSGMKFQIAPRCASPSALVAYYESLFPAPLPEATRREFIRAFEYAAAIPYAELFREPLASIPFSDFKDKLSRDPQVVAFFASIAANSTMCEADEAMRHLSAGGLLSTFRFWWMSEAHCVAFKPNYVEGLVKPFVDAMGRHGGELFVGTEVSEVLIENGTAVGVSVKTAGGERREIRAGKVVVNADFTSIPRLFRVVPPEVQRPIDAYTALPFHDFTLYAELDRSITAEPHPVSVVDPQDRRQPADDLGDLECLPLERSGGQAAHLRQPRACRSRRRRASGCAEPSNRRSTTSSRRSSPATGLRWSRRTTPRTTRSGTTSTPGTRRSPIDRPR